VPVACLRSEDAAAGPSVGRPVEGEAWTGTGEKGDLSLRAHLVYTMAAPDTPLAQATAYVERGSSEGNVGTSAEQTGLRPRQSSTPGSALRCED